MKYAERTDVTADKSRNEIEAVLRRYGATGFSYGWQDRAVRVGFQMRDRTVVFRLEMPGAGSPAFTKYVTRGKTRLRTASQAAKLHEQATRQRWRALLLVVKAKLEAIAAGISSFEDEFLAFVVLPDGSTVGENVRPLIAQAYASGQTPPRLLPFRAAE